MRVNALVAKAQKTPEDGWTMADGTPWPGNNPRDHPGMIQVTCYLLTYLSFNKITMKILQQSLHLLLSDHFSSYSIFLRSQFLLLEVLVFAMFSYSIIFLLIQVFLGHSGAHDIEGNELPRLVYVSREKRPGYQHHKKAGAENALVCSKSNSLALISEDFCLLPFTNLLFFSLSDKGVCSSHKCTLHSQS